MKFVTISGSLRRESFSTQIADTLADLAPEGVEVERLEIGTLPFYDEDLKKETSPEAVRVLAAKIAAADALVIVSPEYNRSMSGVLKNALDWLSKEPGFPLAGKPVEIITQSPGATGGLVANYAIRDTLVVPGAHVQGGFEAAISAVAGKVDGTKLTDKDARDFLAGKLAMLASKAGAKAEQKAA